MFFFSENHFLTFITEIFRYTIKLKLIDFTGDVANW